MQQQKILPLLILFSLGLAAQPQLKSAAARSQPAASPPSAALTPPTLRLPTSVRPVDYTIKLQLIPSADSFRGEMDIALELEKPEEVLWLNGSSDLKIEAASISQPARPALSPIAISQGGRDFIGFRFAAPLSAGSARLHLRYTGRLPHHEGVGLFSEHDGNDDYIFTDFEPSDARRAFPCFDEPGYKVPVRFILDVPAKHLAVSNAPIESEQPLAGGLKRVVFRRSLPMPSYLWAIGVGPFGVVDAGRGGSRKVPLRILTLRGREAAGRYAAQVTAPIIDLLERYTGVPFPYEKLDEITVPNQGGAMENPGLITYGQKLIELGADNDTVAARRRLAKVIAHELAHHYTGDLVTLRYWDDTWLNESFASFLASKVIEQFKPEWNERLDRLMRRQEAMDADSLLSARRIRQPIQSRDDIANAFDSITYAKGQSVLTMLEGRFGAPLFARGLTRYLTAHAHENAVAQDFIAALSAEAQAAGQTAQAAELPKILASFLDEPGVPLVSLSLVCDAAGPRLRYRQARYLPIGTQPAAKDATVYALPLSIDTDRGARLTVLLDKAAGELPLAGGCPKWVHADPEGIAYAYIRYEGELLPALVAHVFATPAAQSKRLGSDPMTETMAQELALLFDMAALFRSGDVAADRLLATVAQAAKVPGRFLVSSGGHIVHRLSELAPPASRPHLAGFVRKTFLPRLLPLGLRNRPSDDDEARLLRQSLLPLVLGEGGSSPLDGQLAALQSEAERLLTAWLADPNALDAESAHTLALAAPQRAGGALFQSLYKAARGAKDRNLRTLLLDALGSFREPAMVRASLDLVLSGEFEVREAMRLIQGAAAHPESHPIAYAFVQKHFDELVAKLPREAGSALPRIAAGFCDEAARADAEAFFSGRSTKYIGGPRVLKQTLERITQCSELRKAQGEKLAAFLAAY